MAVAKLAEIVKEHPKLVEKWALRYIHLYKTQGPDAAKKWALEFLPPEPRSRMSERVNQIWNGKKK